MNSFLYITLVQVVYLGITVLNPYVLNGKTLSLLYNIQLLCCGKEESLSIEERQNL